MHVMLFPLLIFNSASILEPAKWQRKKESVPGACAQRDSRIKKLGKIKTQAPWVYQKGVVLSSWLILETQFIL